MKQLLILITILGATSALASKTYTVEEFIKKVNEEVNSKVDDI